MEPRLTSVPTDEFFEIRAIARSIFCSELRTNIRVTSKLPRFPVNPQPAQLAC